MFAPLFSYLETQKFGLFFFLYKYDNYCNPDQIKYENLELVLVIYCCDCPFA